MQFEVDTQCKVPFFISTVVLKPSHYT